MLNLFVAAALPPLLVFGLYHLLTWFNAFRINEHVFWKRVALASAIAHVLLATGFFIFTYFDFAANRDLTTAGLTYGTFLFDRSNFWYFGALFDTFPTLLIVGLFAVLDRLGINPPGILALTIAITSIAGTAQWYFLGGGIGSLLERFWGGLKTGEDDEDEWGHWGQ
jgi:hypothetical protein